jgi:hypothetical protein
MRMIELFTTGPDRVLNLNRGRLAIGAPADITIFDTERAWTYDVNRSASKSRNSPFHGHSFPRRSGRDHRQRPGGLDRRWPAAGQPKPGHPGSF